MPALKHCSECGVALSEAEQDGLCVRCLLGLGLRNVAAPRESAADVPTPASLPKAAPNPTDLALSLNNSGGFTSAATEARRFGDYELLEEIARGGMGVVYRARQVSLDRIVAVKMLLAGPLAGKDFVQRFRTEAAAAASLRHPNIVAIYEVGFAEGQHFFAMDYVEGLTLAQLVTNGPLPGRQAATYLETIAEAIHFAHERNVLHRDLKPSNVLVDSATDQPRVTDFGLAKRLEAETELTLSGQVLGSPNYMSPEQAAAKRGMVGKRSDVYSLGAILYHLLTGRPPFQGETLTEVLHQVMNTEPLSPRALNPSVPPDLETICLKCLEKEPGKRYATAKDLSDELGRFLKDELIQARPVGQFEKLWRWCRRKPALASSLAGILALALIVLVGSPIALYRINQAKRAEQSQRREAERNLYATDMILAQQALEMNNMGRARFLLGRHRPSGKSESRNLSFASDSDPRGWEWHYLWNRIESDELPSLRLGPCPLGSHSVVPSPDGKLLATKLADEESFQVWDLVAKRVLGTYSNSNGIPWSFNNRSCAFSSNGSVLAVAWTGGVVRRFGPRTLKEVAPELHVTGEIEDVYYSPDGKLLTVASRPGTNTTFLTSFSTQDDRIVGVVPLPGRGSLAMAADQRTAAIGLSGGTIEIYEPSSGSRRASFKFGSDWTAIMTLSADGTYLGISDRNQRAELWDVTKVTRLDWASTHAALVRNFAFSPDGKLMATTSYDQVVKLWELPSGKELMTLKGHEGMVYCASFMPDGQTLVTGCKDETIRFWDTRPRSVPTNIQPLARGPKPPRVWIAPTSDVLLIVRPNDHSSNIVSSLWNVQRWSATEEQTIPLSDFVCGAVSPGGKLLALASARGSVLLWDAENGRAATTVQNAPERIGRLQFSTNGRLLAVATENRWTRIWDVAQTNLMLKFAHRRPERPDYVKDEAMCFSPDGALLAQAEAYGHIEIWDIPQRKSVSFWRADGKFVSTAAFSPDGKAIATTGYDEAVRLWDVATGTKLKEFRSSIHSSMFSVGFSADSRRLVTGMFDASVKLWDTDSEQELLTLKGHKTQLIGVAFSQDRETLVTASPMEVIRWPAHPLKPK